MAPAPDRLGRALDRLAQVRSCNGWLLLLGAVVLALLVVATVRSPVSPVLRNEAGAVWIRQDRPVWLGTWTREWRVAVFRTRVQLDRPARGVDLRFRAMKAATVFVDRVRVFEDPAGTAGWNFFRSVRLPDLASGVSHEILFVVQSADSHPALLAHAPALGLATGTAWEVSTGDRIWTPALRADRPPVPEIAQPFPTTFAALGRAAPVLVPLLVFAAFLAWRRSQRNSPPLRSGQVRWILIALMALLAANNLVKLPLHIGMDNPAHLEYIRHIAEGRGLPLAGMGWQMFQPPLYYLASAPLLLLVERIAPATVEYALRLVPWACGLLQVELCYRALRAVHPHREDLQIVGLLLSALLPVNLYMSQTIGNEPVSALFSSLALVLLLQRLRGGFDLASLRFPLQLGGVVGLALLAKSSNLIPAVLLPAYALAWGLEGRPWRDRVRSGSRFLAAYSGSVLLVAGWYYARNWWHLGSPFVGGWDPRFGRPWWQDHGYVAWSSLMNFGRALVQPVYAQTAGFLDGVYATFWTDGGIGSVIQAEFVPPWNFTFLLASALLSLIPCAVLFVGAVRGFGTRPVRLAVTTILAFLAAILWLHITAVPTYSTLKGSYLLGLLPCFGILGAAGFEALARRPFAAAVILGLLVCWSGSALAGFWVL